MKKLTAILLIGLALVAGVTAQNTNWRPQPYFDGYTLQLPSTNSLYGYIWRQLFAPGQTNYAERSAWLGSLTPTNTEMASQCFAARVYVEGKEGNTAAALAVIAQIPNENIRAECTMNLYCFTRNTNAYVDYCQNQVTNKTLWSVARLNVAYRYGRYLGLQGRADERSDTAKAALEISQISRVMPNTTRVFDWVSPARYPDYKEWLGTVIGNIDVTTNNAAFLGKLQSKYELLP